MQLSSLWTYFQVRFPLAGVAFLALITAFSTASLYSGLPTTEQLTITLLIALNFAALLLRQRIVDEFKDKDHDKKNYPDRPFVKGLISAKSLIIIGAIASVIELLSVYAIGGTYSLLLYSPVIAYSLLMSKEFFCSAWLTRHFTTYFVLHELIFLFYGYWMATQLGFSFSGHVATWLVLFICLVVAIEIGRKFKIRKDPKGRVVADTYTAIWGLRISVSILGLLIVSAGLLLTYLTAWLLPAAMAATCALLIHIFKNRPASITQLIIIVFSIALVILGVIS